MVLLIEVVTPRAESRRVIWELHRKVGACGLMIVILKVKSGDDVVEWVSNEVDGFSDSCGRVD